MDKLRPATTRYIAALTILAVVLAGVALAWGAPLTAADALLAAAVAGAVALAWLFPIHLFAGTKFYVDTAITVAAVLLLPPAPAMLAVGGGTLLAHLLRPASRDRAQALFNAAQTALVAGAVALLLAGGGWDPRRPAFDDPRLLLLLPAAGLVLHLLSVFFVASVTAIEAGQSVATGFWEALRADPLVEAAAQVSLVATGVLAALIARTHPWAILLLAVPLLATYVTLRHQSRLRRLAEQARLESDAGLAEAQRLARIGSWEWDPATDRQVWSAETYRLLGREPEAVTPTLRAFLDAIVPDDRAAVARALEETRRTMAPLRIDHRVRVRGGALRLVHLRGDPRGNGGTPRVIGTIQDVTERAETAEALRRAKEAAEEADRAKSRLLSTASHDLRTPLTAVRGYLEILRAEAGDHFDPEQREFIEIAYHNALRLSALVDDLLDLAKIEAGRVTLRIRPVAVAETVEEVVEALTPQATAKGLRLEAPIPPGLPAVAADPGRLYQMLVNLVGNAVKFTDRGGVTIAARPDSGAVEVTVSDTGIGISPDALPFVFDEFSQEGEAAQRRGGAGLGLAIAKRLAELHGGTIAARSVVGAGSTFTLRLPAVPEEAAARPAAGHDSCMRPVA